MSPINVFYPVLVALEDGKIIRRAAALVLRIAAVVVLMAGMVLVVQVLKFGFSIQDAEGTIGGLALSALLVTAFACVAQVLLYRARSIGELGESPFTVLPILSILLRTIGEVYMVLGVFLGVGGCLFIWLARLNPLQLLGRLGGILPSSNFESSVFGGITFLAYLTLFSLCVLMVFYFLAESIVVIADIARNVRILVELKRGAVSSAHLTVRPSSKCPACGSDIEEDSEFCGHCGVRVRGH